MCTTKQKCSPIRCRDGRVFTHIAENIGVDRKSSPWWFHLSTPLGGDFNTAGGLVEKAIMAVPTQVDSIDAIGSILFG